MMLEYFDPCQNPLFVDVINNVNPINFSSKGKLLY